jgi:ABC-type cobalt transport system substrate-binding protein
MFNDWWKTLEGFDKDVDALRNEYDAWFESKYEKPSSEEVTE